MTSHQKKTTLILWIEKDLHETTLNKMFDNIAHYGVCATLCYVGWKVFNPHEGLAIGAGLFLLSFGLILTYLNILQSMVLMINCIITSDPKTEDAFHEIHSTPYFIRHFWKQFIVAIIYTAISGGAFIVLLVKLISMIK